MKIVDVDQETKKSKFKRHILPIIKTGLGLGVTCYFIKTGVLNYNDLINMEKVTEFLPSNNPILKNIPILPQELDLVVKLMEGTINTVGLNKMMIATKALPFISDITKPILESDKIKNSPVVHKIKEIFKRKNKINELETTKLENNEEDKNSLIDIEETSQENEKESEKKKIPETVKNLIIGAASLGLSAYLIATNQVNFNNSYNFDNLPHKFAKIKEIAKNLNMNTVHLGLGALNIVSTILKKDTKTIETPPMMAAAPINYRKILDAVIDFDERL